MSLPVPLSVRLRTARADLNITSQVRDLVMRWSDPGGYSTCRVPLDRPLSLQPDEIGYYGAVTVYDGRHGGVVWDGRQEDPARSAGGDGQVWELTAVGGQAHTRDRKVPYVIIDSEPVYERVDNVTPGGNDSIGASPGDAAGADRHLILQFPQGLGVATNSRIVMRYNRIWRAGGKLARIAYTWDAGVTDANHAIQAVTRTDGSLGGGEVAETANFNVAGGSGVSFITTDWPTTRNTVELRQIRTAGGASTIPSDLYWVAVKDEQYQATRYNLLGAELTAALDYINDYVAPHEVVIDLLGRLLTGFEAGTISTAGGFQIRQLSYPDGVDSARVLADLMLLEAGLTWRVWERGSTGKFRFEWVPVPAAIRYEADIIDGYDSQGSADGLFNRVTVRWRDAGGHIRTTERTASVPILDAAGLIRQDLIDLGDEVSTQAAAERAGDQWLSDRKYPPNAGKLTVARPILDLQTGRMVMPWEIRPGLIRVRGVLPRPDALNSSTRDGVTVFRIRAAEYHVRAGAAVLELDSYPRTVAQTLAEVVRRPVHRRR